MKEENNMKLKTKGINVLSLFDGISCGRVAIERAGIKVNKYYASEIDKHAVQIAQKNYPDTIQVGDVSNLIVKDKNDIISQESFIRRLKSRENQGHCFIKGEIDLLMGGSPCQGFSFAGKQLNFKDERSLLFFEFVRMLKELKPKYFLLENVKMKQEFQDIISEHLGVEPMVINSNLVSAQNRVRLYWTNIPNIKQPKDKGILIKDIIYDNNYKIFEDKRISRTKKRTKNYIKWDISEKGYFSQQDRGYYKHGKMCTIPKANPSNKLNILIDYENDIYRRMHPVEAERCQTLPDNFTQGLSDGVRISLIGNGWTVDVLYNIFKNIKL